jgi:type VI secretion system secreted protein Hcp
MAFDSFLYFQARDTNYLPKGESTDSQFMSFYAFEIKSFSFSVQNNVTISSQSMGAGAGRGVFEKFKFQKSIDRGSPSLFAACAAGKHLDAAVLVLRKAGGAAAGNYQPCYLVYKFLFCYIDTVSWSGSSGDDVPTEDVSFAYGAMGIYYRKQNSKGELEDKPFIGKWSQVSNRSELVVPAKGSIVASDIKLPSGAESTAKD